MYSLRIDSKFMENFGSSTLTGALANKYGAVAMAEMKEVTLQFVQTTNRYREKHGPQHWIMPEYASMCLASNIAYLVEIGIKLKIETLYEDPE